MPWEYHVYIVNPDDLKIYVEHIFYGETKDACLQVKTEHLASCAYYRQAEEDGRIDDRWKQIPASALPHVGEAEDDDGNTIDL